MKSRSELREIAMKVIYQILVMKKSDLEFDVDKLISEHIDIENGYLKEIVNGYLEKENEIRTIANNNMNDWTIDRLNLVDQSILSIGIYELLFSDTPAIVAINEAVEISKKYSDEAVVKMINAILDNIYHNMESENNG